MSIDGTGTSNNDVMQLATSPLLDLSDYILLSGQIYITSWPSTGTKEVQILGWDTSTGSVGTTVNIGNYVDTNTLNTWQSFSIPISDMSLIGASVDAFRITSIDLGPGVTPNYYLDAITLIELGGSGDSQTPEEYSVTADKGTWLYVETIHFTIVDEYAGTLADATMPLIPYDGFLGLGTLERGINYSRSIGDKVQFNLSIKDLVDLISLPGVHMSGNGSDGVNTWVSFTMELTEPIVLKYENMDKLSATVQDDLSSLKFFRASVGCKIEQRAGSTYEHNS